MPTSAGEHRDDGEADLRAGGDVEDGLVVAEHRVEPVLEEVQVVGVNGRLRSPPTMARPASDDQRQRSSATATRAGSTGVDRPSCALVLEALLAEEDQEDLAAHVERGQQRGDQAEAPQ